MHEMALAISIVDVAVSEARKAAAVKINEIELDVGKLAGVVIDALEFSFEAACKDTEAEGAHLNISEIEALAKCLDCGSVVKVESIMEQCDCGSYKLDLFQGQDLKVRAINID